MKRQFTRLVLTALIGGFSLVGPAGAQEATAIVGATLFDGSGAPPLANAVIVIEGDRIRSVGPADRTPVPPGARVFDAAGKYVIPGLADMHNHLGHAAFGPVVFRDVFRDLLRWGVTTAFNPGSAFSLSQYHETQLAASEGPAPRVYQVFRTFGAPGGWGGMNYTPASPVEVEAAMDELTAVGADAVKLIYDDMSVLLPNPLPMMRADVMAAVVRSAHEHGLKVFVHVLKLEAAKEVIRAGADGLAHAVVDLPVDDEFLDLMRSSGAHYMSTQSFFESRDVRALTRRIIDLDPGGLEANPAYQRILNDELFTRGAERESKGPLARANLKAVFDAGIPVVIGTDTGANPALVPGIATHMELLLHVESGIGPADVLVVATRNAARMLDLDQQQGTAEEGKLADMLILDADPLEDIRNTTRIHRIVKGGTFFAPEQLRR